MDTALLFKALGAFFAIMNPFVNLPLFLSLTSGEDAAQQRRTAWRTVALSAAMCAVVAVAGSALLKLFGVSVDDFRVAGGASAHEGTSAEKDHAAERAVAADVSFYPMTFPIIVGPGTITTIIVMISQGQDASDKLMVALALIVVLALLGAVLYFSSAIGHHMSLTLRVIMTRLMGMILAAISIGMLATGLKDLLPGLAG